VIGGLVADKVTNSEVKVPLLGDIPVLGALFRSTQSKHERGDLVLILTPYIVRDQEDMRRIVERRMEERQEFLEHEAIFSDRPHTVPKTFARARGVLGLMRKQERAIEAERALEASLTPRPVLGHEGTDPIDLPAAPAASGATPAAPPPSPVTPGGVRLER
jgi:general secretion pathway protein D